MERKLATIRKIKNIEKISDEYTKIMKARVDGWNVIIKNDEFKNNDMCIFF